MEAQVDRAPLAIAVSSREQALRRRGRPRRRRSRSPPAPIRSASAKLMSSRSISNDSVDRARAASDPSSTSSGEQPMRSPSSAAGRVAPEVVGQPVAVALHPLRALLQAARGPYRPGEIAQIAFQLTVDRRHREGGECDSAFRVEALDRLEQADRGDLLEVVQRHHADRARSAARSTSSAAGRRAPGARVRRDRVGSDTRRSRRPRAATGRCGAGVRHVLRSVRLRDPSESQGTSSKGSARRGGKTRPRRCRELRSAVGNTLLREPRQAISGSHRPTRSKLLTSA